MDKEGVKYVLIKSRLKEFKRFEEKMIRKRYDKPEDIKDLAGIMIVASVLSNAELISKIIKREKEFEIDWDNSVDHSIRLAEDRVGYRGKNYVGKVREDAFATTEEYEKFKELNFEIQIKTLLDFAWGEIEHDRNYKIAEELQDTDIPRRFKIVAGALEIVDNEFERLSKETEHIADPILKKISRGDLNIPISPFSIRGFLTLNFNDIPGFREQFVAPTEDLFKELNSEINTIAELNDIILPDVMQFKQKYAEVSKPKDYVSFSALIRDILIIHDPVRYFDEAWKNHYNTLENHSWKVYEKFKVDRRKFPKSSKLDFKEGGDDE
jgi:putative GTP pyrophosphokinase